MNVLIGLLFAIFATPGYPTSDVQRSCHAGEIVGRAFSANRQAGATQPPASRGTANPHRALLDSLGAYQKTTLVREYVLTNGGLGRQYASDLPLDQAPTAVTVFYRNKLSALGWQTLEEHAAVSCYAKGTQTVSILRDGPNDPGLPTGARLVRSAAPSAGAKFFFAIEAAPKQ
jgi:hypothetical protein